MDRREFLQTASALGAVGLAGCTRGDGDDGDETAEEPDARISISEQQSDGETLTLDRVETDATASLALVDEQGEAIGGVDETFGGGTELEEYEVQLEEPLGRPQTVTARLVHPEHDAVAESSARIHVVQNLEESEVQIARGETAHVEADPESGFEYSYYVYVPEDVPADGGPVLVEPNNTGTSTDLQEEHRLAARRLLDGRVARTISDELSVPLLVPTFPRPSSDPVGDDHYVHALDTETMQIDDGPLERVDLQLLAMVDHLRRQLEAIGYPADEEVLLDGFSASGNFVNRFAALHPDRVRSVTAGGINGTAILPLESHDGRTLPYQVGIADLESLLGSEFDRDAWTDVAQYVYMGGEDENDTIPYDDAWSDEQRELALAVYGEDMQEERMPFCESVYDDAGASAQFTIYPTLEHEITSHLIDDLVEFHRQNLDRDAGIERIDPFVLGPGGVLQLSIAEQPSAGDEAVRVHASVEEDVDFDDDQISTMVYEGSEADFDARIDSRGGSGGYFEPGDDRTATVSLDTSADVVPLQSGQTITVALVDGSPLVTVTTTVE